jgi:hypothetical protein
MRRGRWGGQIKMYGYCKGREARIPDLLPCISFDESGTGWNVGCVTGMDASELRRKLHVYIAVDDVLRMEDVHRVFISFLEDELKLPGPWPAPTTDRFSLKGDWFDYLVLRLEALPGVQMRNGRKVGRIELHGHIEKAWGVRLACIRFYGSSMQLADGIAISSTAAGLCADLREIVRRVDDAGHLGARAELLGLARDVVRLWEARSARRCLQ